MEGEIKAYRGRCPHQDVPLENASFDGNQVSRVCAIWRVWVSPLVLRSPHRQGRRAGRLRAQAVWLRLEHDEVFVDLG